MSKSKYGKSDHRKCWMLWKEKGLSLRDIADREDTPSRETVRKWAGDYDCPFEGCDFHNWRAKRAELLEQANEEVKEELDLPDAVEREKNQLRLIYQTQKQIMNLLESGALEQPTDMKSAVDLLKELNDEERLIKGEAQAVTEVRGADNRQLSLTKIAKQLNLKAGDEITERDLVEAAEDVIVEGDPDDE